MADNQTGALAEWDDEILNAALDDLTSEGWDIAELGFDKAIEPEILSLEDAFASLPDGERPDATQMTFVLTLDQAEIVKQSVDIAKKLKGFDLDTGNSNGNGNALAVIAESFIRVNS